MVFNDMHVVYSFRVLWMLTLFVQTAAGATDVWVSWDITKFQLVTIVDLVGYCNCPGMKPLM